MNQEYTIIIKKINSPVNDLVFGKQYSFTADIVETGETDAVVDILQAYSNSTLENQLIALQQSVGRKITISLQQVGKGKYTLLPR